MDDSENRMLVVLNLYSHLIDSRLLQYIRSFIPHDVVAALATRNGEMCLFNKHKEYNDYCARVFFTWMPSLMTVHITHFTLRGARFAVQVRQVRIGELVGRTRRSDKKGQRWQHFGYHRWIPSTDMHYESGLIRNNGNNYKARLYLHARFVVPTTPVSLMLWRDGHPLPRLPKRVVCYNEPVKVETVNGLHILPAQRAARVVVGARHIIVVLTWKGLSAVECRQLRQSITKQRACGVPSAG
jgi:hypothetical protein